MRTRTGWLAWLLTAGMALTPSAARAQGGLGSAVADWPYGNMPAAPPSGDVWSGIDNPPLPTRPVDPLDLSGPYADPLPMPPTFRGQVLDYDMPQTDPEHASPLPLGHDRMETGGFFVAMEFLYYHQTNPLKNQTIAVRGFVDTDGSVHAALPTGVIENPPNQPIFAGPPIPIPGGFIGSAVPALSSQDASGPSSYAPGWRVTAGYRFEEGFVVEAYYDHINNVRYIAGATLVPPGMNSGQYLQDSFLYSPVYNFPTQFAGPSNKIAIGSPTALYGIWDGATETDIRFDQFMEEWLLGARIPMFETEYNRCYCLAGMHNVWIHENFQWRTVDYNDQGQTPDGAADSAIYNNIVSNVLYGPYVGAGNEIWLGKGFSVAADARAGLLADFVDEIATYQLGDRSIELKRDRRLMQLSPELTGILNLMWYPIEGVQIKVGYQWMCLFNTQASPYPVSFDALGLDPPWQTQVFRLIDGFTAGIGFIF